MKRYFLTIFFCFLTIVAAIAASDKFNEYLAKAQKGDAKSQYDVARCYWYGSEGVKVNNLEALKWARLSAKGGCKEAYSLVGHLTKDNNEAILYYNKAIKEAQYTYLYKYLGDCYLKSGNTPKAIDCYNNAIANKDYDGYAKIGELYEKQNKLDEASKYYALGLEQYNGECIYNIARLYEKGIFLKQDYLQAERLYNLSVYGDFKDCAARCRTHLPADYVSMGKIAILEDIAGQGNGRAAAELSNGYLSGESPFERNNVKAINWLRKAAELGDADSMAELAKILLDGQYGQPTDAEDALTWAKKADESGNMQGTYLVGRYYDKKELKILAQYYFIKAADGGYKDAYFYAANSLQYGFDGAKKDMAKAAKYYRLAGYDEMAAECEKKAGSLASLIANADTGDQEAIYLLADAYEHGTSGAPNDKAKAIAYYEKAANKGHIKSMKVLGDAYRLGLSLTDDKKNFDKFIFWYDNAAKAGDKESAKKLGDTYYFGFDDVAKDYSKASYYYSLAGDTSLAKLAKDEMNSSYSTGTTETTTSNTTYVQQSKGTAVLQILGVLANAASAAANTYANSSGSSYYSGSTYSSNANTTAGKSSSYSSYLNNSRAYDGYVDMLIDMNVHWETKYISSKRIEYQNAMRSIRLSWERQGGSPAIYKSKWEDWDGRKQ